jgi:spore coat protein U-like protein
MKSVKNWGLNKFAAMSTILLATTLSMSLSTHAVTIGGQINVTIEIGSGCQVNAVDNAVTPIQFGVIDFGDWMGLSAATMPTIDADTSGSAGGGVTIECNSPLGYTIGINNGLHFDGTTRRMNSATTYVSYGLYQDAARSIPWLSGTPAVFTSAGTSTAPSAITHHFYGRVAPQDQLIAGIYNDTVQVEITW